MTAKRAWNTCTRLLILKKPNIPGPKSAYFPSARFPSLQAWAISSPNSTSSILIHLRHPKAFIFGNFSRTAADTAVFRGHFTSFPSILDRFTKKLSKMLWGTCGSLKSFGLPGPQRCQRPAYGLERRWRLMAKLAQFVSQCCPPDTLETPCPKSLIATQALVQLIALRKL
jgi:hypothetical protein